MLADDPPTQQVTQYAQDVLDTVAWVRSADSSIGHMLAGRVALDRGIGLAGHGLVRPRKKNASRM